MKRILLLTDYRAAFCSNITTMNGNVTMDVNAITRHFIDAGYDIEVRKYAHLNLADDYRGVHVLYTSSEDSNLAYKSYIEDIVLTLEVMGANLLPYYKFLRAHHNKSMMEALRYHLFPDEAVRLDTRIFGTLEELAETELSNVWPKVIKAAFGGGSVSVAMVKNHSELMKIAEIYSESLVTFSESVRERGKRILRKGWQHRSLHRNKFVVQNMIQGLSGDFKVLCFGTRYYTLYRKNRPGDFRASGSGIFSSHIPDGISESALLDYAAKIYATLDTPLASLDIAFDGKTFHLIEYQVLHFGTLTAERSTYYHTLLYERWERIVEKCDIEKIYCEAIAKYIELRSNEVNKAVNRV